MRCSGFTLIEIIVSVTILLLLSGLFIANYNGFSNSQTVKQAASDLITNLRSVRTNASAGVKPSECDTLIGYRVVFTATTYTAQALCLAGSVGTPNSYTLPTGVTFPSPTPGPITFYALNRGASADQTLSIVGNGITMNVSVFASGVVSDYVATPTP